MTLHPGEFVVDRKWLVANALGVSVWNFSPPTTAELNSGYYFTEALSLNPKGKCRSCGSYHYISGVCAYCRTPA